MIKWKSYNVVRIYIHYIEGWYITVKPACLRKGFFGAGIDWGVRLNCAKNRKWSNGNGNQYRITQ